MNQTMKISRRSFLLKSAAVGGGLVLGFHLPSGRGPLQAAATQPAEVNAWIVIQPDDTVIIRVDGSLAPCFPMYSATHDWGFVGAPKFDTKQLREMKDTCETHCFSTLNHIVGYCYNDRRVINWLFKQARHGFQGVTGSFE